MAAKYWVLVDTKKGTDAEACWRVEGGRNERIEKLPIRWYWAYYLDDEIICSLHPQDMQFTYVTNLHPCP